MKEPKFKTGDLVTLLKSSDLALHIIEIEIHICPDGTQIVYTGKLYHKKTKYHRLPTLKEETLWMLVDYAPKKFHEIELKEIALDGEVKEMKLEPCNDFKWGFGTSGQKNEGGTM